MYTESQREKAIKLYIQYGLKAAPVIRELGYPDRHSLKNWYNSFMINNKKIIITHSRKPKYTEFQRKEAVDFYLNHGYKCQYNFVQNDHLRCTIMFLLNITRNIFYIKIPLCLDSYDLLIGRIYLL